MTPATVFAATATILLVFNVVRALGVFGDRADAAAVAVLVALVALAAVARMGAADLGLARADLGAGAAWGAAAFALVAVVVGAGALLPATSGLFEDARANISASALAFEIVVGIFIATVLPEEFAFRGLLLGAGVLAWGKRTALLATSALFGLWHISPTLSTMSDNAATADTASSPAGSVALVAGSVALTFVAGMVFGWLRLRSKSLLAPVLAHLATNGVALTVAWLLLQ